MNDLAHAIEAASDDDGNLARRILDPLTEADGMVRYLHAIQFDRVRLLQPLGREFRADALPRAARRLDEFPAAVDLEGWYRIAKTALSGRPEEALSRVLVALMLDVLRGPLPRPRVTIDAFVLALEDAGFSPQVVAGGVKRSWVTCKTKPSIALFISLCRQHRAEIQTAHDNIVRAIGLRLDAEKVLAAAGRAIGPQGTYRHLPRSA